MARSKTNIGYFVVQGVSRGEPYRGFFAYVKRFKK